MAEQKQSAALTDIITTAISLPGVKVSRDAFLRETFRGASEERMAQLLADGPVAAGCTQRELRDLAAKVLRERTMLSTTASFAAGLPGGLAMAATIPADLMQFYGVSLRMAQEIAYIYGEPDPWQNGAVDDERVRNQLILYCGVMFGANGAAQGLKVMSSALAKQAMKKLPQQALTKTFFYPLVKSVCKFFGVKMTKNIFAKGVSKAIPLVGGVLSGGITFASMRGMGTKLIDTLEEAHFHYTEEELQQDWETIIEVCAAETAQAEAEPEEHPQPLEAIVVEEVPVAEEAPVIEPAAVEAAPAASISAEIMKAKGLLDAGIITEAEFAAIKEKLIAQL